MDKSFTQHERADFIIQEYIKLESQNKSIPQNRKKILDKVINKFGSCHSCLLLATYGLYKNGLIKDTGKKRNDVIDFTGFNGKVSGCIEHAINAYITLLQKPHLSGKELNRKHGGDRTIYSFVKYYSKNELLVK